MENGHPQSAGVRLGEQPGRLVELALPQAARLVAPGPDRVQADDVQVRRAVDGLGRLPLALELGEGAGEAGRGRVRDVVVARDDDQGGPQPP